MTNEQKIAEFFEQHPGAALLVSEHLHAEVAATGVPCCQSDLLADGTVVAVDIEALRCPRVMETQEIKAQEPAWWKETFCRGL